MELDFVITNDKESYVAKEDSICLFSIAEEAALNKQWIKPCVPLPILHQHRITDAILPDLLYLQSQW